MLKKMLPEDMERLFPRIQKDFPPDEYPPKHIMRQRLEEDFFRGFFFLDDNGEEKGYALLTRPHEGFVLVFLYAVFEEYRAQGIGTRFMQELIDSCSDQKAIFLEVERPRDTEDPAEKQLRLRRIRFYHRLGYKEDRFIDYSIYRVPMYLMARPITQQNITSAQLKAAVEGVYDDMAGGPGKRRPGLVYCELVDEEIDEEALS